MIPKSIGLIPNSSLLLLCALAIPVSAAEYFVDSQNGADANNGQSAALAWKSLSPLRSRAFQPGDVVHFMAGSTFTEALNIDDNGTQAAPITFKAAGTGAMPLFSGQGIKVSGDWNVVDGLMVKGARYEGINISAAANRNVVRNCDVSECGSGFAVYGTDNLITRNLIHDLKMVTNTEGGDDDNGATGIWMHASRVEISYNRFVKCKAESFDYEFDGGAVEWWAEKALDSCYVHHNFATGCEGFLEAGGRGFTISNSRVEYNVSVNNGWFGLLNSNGQYAIVLDNFVIQNNTVIQTVPHDGWGATRTIFFNNTSAKSLTLRNNVFYLTNWYVCDASPITHVNNLYRLQGGGLGFTLGATEKNGDPLFVDLAGGDYRLKAGSPAIDMGAAVTTTLDHADNPAVVGGKPDAGAFEYQGTTSLMAVAGSMKVKAGSRGGYRRGRFEYRMGGPASDLSLLYDAAGKAIPPR